MLTEAKQRGDTDTTVTVLIADPLRIVREGLLALLAVRREVRILGQAGSVEELMIRVAELHPQVTVIEGSYPNCQAFEVVRQLQTACPQGAILLLSGGMPEERILAALEAGAGGYLHKDCRPGELVRAILAVARGEMFLPAAIGKAILAQVSERNRGSRSSATSHTPELTPREQEILNLLLDGLSNKEIAQHLYISVRTVEMHLSNIYGKLGVSSRLEAAAFVARQRR